MKRKLNSTQKVEFFLKYLNVVNTFENSSYFYLNLSFSEPKTRFFFPVSQAQVSRFIVTGSHKSHKYNPGSQFISLK